MDIKHFDIDDCSYTYYCCIAFNKRDLKFIKDYMETAKFRKHMFFNMLFPGKPLYRYSSIYNEITDKYEYILYINKRKAFDKSHGIYIKKDETFELLYYVNVSVNKLVESCFIQNNTKISRTVLDDNTNTMIYNISCDSDIKYIRVDKIDVREYTLHLYGDDYIKQKECKVKFHGNKRTYSMLTNYLDIIRVDAIIKHYDYLDPSMCFINYT